MLECLLEKFDHGKKSLLFEWCLMLIQKYVFWREKSCSMLTIFSHQKSSIFFVLMLDAVQICRFFFPLGNPPYAKKCKRDSLYFDLLPGPFKSAIFFIFVHSIKNNKRKETILEIKYLFYCKFIYWVQEVLQRDN